MKNARSLQTVANSIARQHGCGRADEIVAHGFIGVVLHRKYHWETPAGDYVRYPSAYMKAFGRPIYIPSHTVVSVM